MHKFVVLSCATACFVGAGVARAGVAPALTMDVSLGGTGFLIEPTGVLGENGYLYERTDPLTTNVFDGTGSIDITWSWLADASPGRGFGGPVSLNGGLTVQNNSSNIQVVAIRTILPLTSMLSPSSVIGGSVAATLNASMDGGTLSTNGNSAFYRGMIDGSVVPGNAADLVPAPSSSVVGPFQPGGFLATSFGNPIPSQSADAITSSIGILILFNLSAGDSMSFTSGFVADIPAPGGAALLAMGGLLVARRRR
ncbi:MAG: hypothetical protein H6814_05790 [Phycisphaeraceae bacterium]|nr:hypothetical protein [Phycisphaeraceae bacterium]